MSVESNQHQVVTTDSETFSLFSFTVDHEPPTLHERAESDSIADFRDAERPPAPNKPAVSKTFILPKGHPSTSLTIFNRQYATHLFRNPSSFADDQSINPIADVVCKTANTHLAWLAKAIEGGLTGGCIENLRTTYIASLKPLDLDVQVDDFNQMLRDTTQHNLLERWRLRFSYRLRAMMDVNSIAKELSLEFPLLKEFPPIEEWDYAGLDTDALLITHITHMIVEEYHSFKPPRDEYRRYPYHAIDLGIFGPKNAKIGADGVLVGPEFRAVRHVSAGEGFGPHWKKPYMYLSAAMLRLGYLPETTRPILRDVAVWIEEERASRRVGGAL